MEGNAILILAVLKATEAEVLKMVLGRRRRLNGGKGIDC